jgi:6-phosphofructokinase 1
MYKTIGVISGGGDAPGLNAVIRAVVKTATGEFGMRVFGIEDSFEGLIGEPRVNDLTSFDVRGLLPRGGTILGTRNRGFFVEYSTSGEMVKLESMYRAVLENLETLGIEALVVVGGDGTMGIAAELEKLGVPLIGVPKTIDNDLACTELTFGFMTALDIATEALDRLHTTAESHDRVMILEVMGRHAGWIALHSGLAGGADVILIPEIPFLMESVAAKVRERERQGSPFSIIVAAEGAQEVGHDLVYQKTGDPHQAPRLGGIGIHIRNELEKLTGRETRAVILGHLQRGGRPNAFDRVLATTFGANAVRALAHGQKGVMVALQASKIITVPLADALVESKRVSPAGQMVRSARDTGISFGAPDEAAHHCYS